MVQPVTQLGCLHLISLVIRSTWTGWRLISVSGLSCKRTSSSIIPLGSPGAKQWVQPASIFQVPRGSFTCLFNREPNWTFFFFSLILPGTSANWCRKRISGSCSWWPTPSSPWPPSPSSSRLPKCWLRFLCLPLSAFCSDQSGRRHHFR